MAKFLPIAVVAVLLAADGFVHGLWTNRWQTSDALQLACARLENVPMVIGDWHGEAMTPLSQREVDQAGFAGYFTRRYANARTGSTVRVLLACGRPGPLSVHTPDICYRGAGYEATGPNRKKQEKIEGRTIDMWQGHFRKQDAASAVELQVSWAWNGAGSWEAPGNPRIAFAGSPVLYKLYVIHESVRDDPQAAKTRSQFVSQLMPALNDSLFPKS